MKFSVMIADPRNIFRVGLRAIFALDERVSHIGEITTERELQTYLHACLADLLIVNRSLIKDMSILPKGHFVILVEQFEMSVFLAACKQGARGYLLENTHADLLLSTLCLREGALLLEPSLTMHLLQFIEGDSSCAVHEELLTPREREIVGLLREGVARVAIARELHISESTLKTHIKNIARKREPYSPLKYPFGRDKLRYSLENRR